MNKFYCQANVLELIILKKETSFPAPKDQITWKDSRGPSMGHMRLHALDQSLQTLMGAHGLSPVVHSRQGTDVGCPI